MSDNATRAPCTVPPLVRWLLRRICRKLVVQGPEHAGRIAEYYRIMRQAAEAEFTEDNDPTLTAFLRECWDTANIELTNDGPDKILLHAVSTEFSEVFETALNIKKIIECQTTEEVDVQEDVVVRGSFSFAK